MKNKKISTSAVAALLLATNLFANDTTEISTITVTSATKSEQSIQDVTSNIEVITKEEIEEKHYTTLSDALNSVPGIDITSNGGLGQTSYVRINGMHYTNILVLIDGIRYNDITNGSAFPENLLLSDVERIEIIKGAQSGIWGADASGGVINIITKNPQDGFNGNINVEYGSFNTKKYEMGLSYKQNKFYGKLNVSSVDSDGFSAQAPSVYDLDNLEDDGYENITISLKTGYNFDNANKIDLSHTRIDSKIEYDANVYEGWNKDYLASANDLSSIKSTSNFSKINFNHINSFNTLNLYANNSVFDRKYSDGTLYKGDVKEFGINSKIDYSKKDFLILGIDRKEFTENDSMNKEYENNGIFLTNSNFFNNNNTILTQSLRYDEYSNFDSKTTGKIGFKQIIHGFTFSTNYGTAYKVPSLNQLYVAYYGNEDLEPEETKAYDVSLKYKHFEVRYFVNEIDNLIGYDPITYVNTQVEGVSTIKGYELNYNDNIMDDTLLSLSYTNLNAKDKDGVTLARVPKETLKLGIDFYGIENFHINLNGEYIGERKDSNYSTAQTGKYMVWNSSINYNINQDLKVYLKFDNIFDEYYQTVDGYATASINGYLGVKYKF